MHRFFLFLFVFLLLSETFADTTDTDSDQCSRRCGFTTVPYPFGFSDGCPIALSCDATTSTATLPYQGDNSTSYHAISFNSTTSTVALALPPSCSRSIADARRALSGANYGVSSRTGLFLRGGCRGTNVSVCSVPAGVMSNLLRTAQCGENSNATAVVACLSSAAPNGTDQGAFLRWEKVESSKCEDVLSSTLYIYTVDGTTSLEFGIVELGWWLNGTCAGGDKRCSANAICSDVESPSGSAGHRCACVPGMDGDGFLAGDGCYVRGSDTSSSSSRKITLPIGLLAAFLLSLGISAYLLIHRQRRRNATKQLPKARATATLFRGELWRRNSAKGFPAPGDFSTTSLLPRPTTSPMTRRSVEVALDLCTEDS
uniref:Uncharacterized protein n=1 Tax=Avena sativa TaxID=4498 RepID=A0ACD5XR03_AVESA